MRQYLVAIVIAFGNRNDCLPAVFTESKSFHYAPFSVSVKAENIADLVCTLSPIWSETAVDRSVHSLESKRVNYLKLSLQ